MQEASSNLEENKNSRLTDDESYNFCDHTNTSRVSKLGLQARMLALSNSATNSQLRHNHPSSPAVQKICRPSMMAAAVVTRPEDQRPTWQEANITEDSQESETESDQSRSGVVLMYSH